MYESSGREVHHTHDNDDEIRYSHGLIGAVFCLKEAQSKEGPSLE